MQGRASRSTDHEPWSGVPSEALPYGMSAASFLAQLVRANAVRLRLWKLQLAASRWKSGSLEVCGVVEWEQRELR